MRESDLDDKYNVTFEYYKEVIKEVETLLLKNKGSFSDFRIYFDDGDDSFERIVFPAMTKFQKSRTRLSIVTDWLEKEKYLHAKSLHKFIKEGVIISSHTASHAALAVYREGKLQATTLDGIYQNSPWGQGDVLSENEILFQLVESKNKLRDNNILTDELVLPHGLYNDTVLRLNYQYGLYKYISTCDEYLDDGEYLRPRFLVDNERSVKDTIDAIKNLNSIEKFKPYDK